MKNNKIKYFLEKGSRLIPDKAFLRVKYRMKNKRTLNLKQPVLYNEKLQWLKIYDRKREYIKYVDKFEVRSYISEKIGKEYLIPLIGVYDRVEDIDWVNLPEKFVLKCTHGSSSNIICSDKSKLDITAAKKKLENWMQKNWFWYGREWPYKEASRKIICEEFLDEGDEELKDYRFFCFNGEPKFITVDFDITNKDNTRRNLYNLEWDLMKEEITYPKELNKKVPKPHKLEEMIRLSEILSKKIPHLRVDFFYINEKIYFGEMTFYHQSGFGKIEPKFDKYLGSLMELPLIK